ncbi:putative lipid II flippase FtsW [Alkalicella caledoniensis]|uniref:Putative lipid II flippase FtsW n=1 Tax=Alkalicella caledoniensis TaxID=2731377 RepID=A0A7G9WC93_ALKCA|nr:putative lipid II flippase FtsW [Alkalicella caledoniensis]QNO16305.1 putative lipid II flippase FtsW [Alkalicella caledoniensis]
MKRKQSPDSVLIIVTFILLGIGLVMVFSSSYHQGMNRYNDGLYFLKRQMLYAIIGLVGMYVCSNFNFWQWRKFITLFFFLNFALLIAVKIPGIGVVRNEAQRWINLGFMQFQPSDFTKFALILFSANYMANKERLTKFFTGIVPLLTVVGLSFGLIMLQPDLGTGISIVGTIGVMLFAAGAKMGHLIGLASLSIPGLIYLATSASYRLKRLTIFMDPWQDPTGGGWQVIQSLYGIAGGGLLGVGLGQSRQTMGFLPEPQNDFIFSIICEELGFLGATFIIILFAILVWRGFDIAIKSNDTFGSYLAMGLTAMIALQVIINIGVVTSSMPTTGITLPLISYGGTSLMITLASLGIILNISRYIN